MNRDTFRKLKVGNRIVVNKNWTGKNKGVKGSVVAITDKTRGEIKIILDGAASLTTLHYSYLDKIESEIEILQKANDDAFVKLAILFEFDYTTDRNWDALIDSIRTRLKNWNKEIDSIENNLKQKSSDKAFEDYTEEISDEEKPEGEEVGTIKTEVEN